MNKNTKIIIVIIIAIIVIGGIWYIATRQAKEEEVIKIGAIDALTGDGSQYGEWARNGLIIASQEINEKGGIKNKRVEIIFEDHKAQPQEAVSAYQKLRFDNIPIIFIGWSSPSLAVAPIANKDKVILITYSATTPLYSSKDDYTFRTTINARQFAKEEAEFLFNNLGKRKIAAIYVNNDFGLGMSNVFIETFEKLGGEILIVENFEQGTKDFRTIITKIRASNPEAIFLVGQLLENGLLVKQMKEMGLNKQIITDIYSVEGSDFMKGASDAAENIIYVAPFFDKERNPDFVSNYREKFGEDPNYMAAQSYDALMIITEMLKLCPSEFDSDCIKNELFKVENFDGASGILTFDEFGDVEKPVMFKTIKDGQFVPYEE